MSDTEKKIDDLAIMMARGFADVATKADLKNLATKDDLGTLATKAELVQLRPDIDLMLDRHIGTFRKDYDELAFRVKKLEEKIFAKT